MRIRRMELEEKSIKVGGFCDHYELLLQPAITITTSSRTRGMRPRLLPMKYCSSSSNNAHACIPGLPPPPPRQNQQQRYCRITIQLLQRQNGSGTTSHHHAAASSSTTSSRNFAPAQTTTRQISAVEREMAVFMGRV